MSTQPNASKAKRAKARPQKPAGKREPARTGKAGKAEARTAQPPKAKARMAKPPKAKPRARKARPAKPEIVRRKLVWRGVLIAIQYQPDGLGYSAHLELRVVAPSGVPIPVTDTGYRSHNIYPMFVKLAGGPVAYVRKWLDQEARSPAYKRALDRWRQLDLFA